MSIALRACILSLLALALSALPEAAQSHSGRWAGGVHAGHHVYHGHRSHWGWGIGLGFGWWPMVPYGVYPGVVLVEPVPAPRGPEPMPDIAPAAPSPPDPVFIPRSAHGAAHTDGDWQACNRRAMAQPGALADAGMFHRSVLACMEQRGYTVK